MDIQYPGIYAAMGMTLLFVLASFIVVVTMVEDWSMIGMVAAGLFLLSVLIIFPHIPSLIAGVSDDERDSLQQEAINCEGLPPE